MKKYCIIILGFFVTNFTFGQDIHFSQFDKSPLQLNPALTGNYNGDWRFSANQRSQWRSVSRSFNTVQFSVENSEERLMPNLYHGFNYMNDVAGDGNYRTHELNISNAYKLFLNQDSSKTLTAGIQIGINNKSIDFNAFKYDLQFNGYKYDKNLPNNENFIEDRYTNFNLGLGLFYVQKLKSKGIIETGASVFNLVSQNHSFFGNKSIIRDRRFVVHGRLTYPIKRDWDIMPGFLFQTQGVYRELNLGSNIRYIQNDKKGEYVAPYAGIWFRTKDAINLVAGLYYNNWIAGVSYDINISELSPASHVRGGLEFSFQYILKFFKPKQAQYRICPNYL